mmetsp:Transcript_21018/g.36087  ORF Transcript_21018/g.36087 Transcript_21018/m.36087 type:complete len:155 (-) Transcript_21018:905-1369(-)
MDVPRGGSVGGVRKAQRANTTEKRKFKEKKINGGVRVRSNCPWEHVSPTCRSRDKSAARSAGSRAPEEHMATPTCRPRGKSAARSAASRGHAQVQVTSKSAACGCVRAYSATSSLTCPSVTNHMQVTCSAAEQPAEETGEATRGFAAALGALIT